MVGIDIVEVERIEKLLAKDNFLSRIFNESEISYLVGKNMNPQSVAGLFAAKEAVVKALGNGIGSGVSFKQITVGHTELGQPTVTLSDTAKKLLQNLKGEQIFLSISHTAKLATAIAIIK